MAYENLRNLLKARREKTEDKDEIDFLAKVMAENDSSEKEWSSLTEKYSDLSKSYKEAILHSSFPETSQQPVKETEKQTKSFDQILSENLSKINKGE